MGETAADRYKIHEVRRSGARRAIGWAAAIVSGMLTEGAHSTNPATRYWLVIDQDSGRTVAQVPEGMADAGDTGVFLHHDLNEMTPERFRQVWIDNGEPGSDGPFGDEE